MLMSQVSVKIHVILPLTTNLHSLRLCYPPPSPIRKDASAACFRHRQSTDSRNALFRPMEAHRAVCMPSACGVSWRLSLYKAVTELTYVAVFGLGSQRLAHHGMVCLVSWGVQMSSSRDDPVSQTLVDHILKLMTQCAVYKVNSTTANW